MLFKFLQRKNESANFSWKQQQQHLICCHEMTCGNKFCQTM